MVEDGLGRQILLRPAADDVARPHRDGAPALSQAGALAREAVAGAVMALACVRAGIARRGVRVGLPGDVVVAPAIRLGPDPAGGAGVGGGVDEDVLLELGRVDA